MSRHIAFYVGSDETVPELMREPCAAYELEVEAVAPEALLDAVERARDERAEVEILVARSREADLDGAACDSLARIYPASRWIWIEDGSRKDPGSARPCHGRVPVAHLEADLSRVLRTQIEELRQTQHRFRLDALAVFELFGRLTELQRSWLARRVHLTCHCPGDTIIRRGEIPDGAYFVVDGEVAVVSEQGTESRILANLGRGEYFGEMSLLTGELRSATVVANSQVTLLFLGAEDFRRFLELHPDRAISLSRTLSSRLNSVLRGRAQVPRALGVVDATGSEHGRHLARRLCEELARVHGREVALLDLGLCGEGLDRERTRSTLVIVAVPVTSPPPAVLVGLQRCDQVLILIGPGEGSLEAARALALRIEPGVSGPSSRIRLVVDGPVPGGEELAGFPGQPDVMRVQGPVPTHDRSPELERLARRILRRALGLVLGGGGMRGFTHIGALEALVAAGIPIDMVGGTSAGAVVAALFARGMEVRSVREFLEKEVARGVGIFDWTVPRTSVTRGKRWRTALSRRFGRTRIEELPIDYFAVASDLVSGEGVLLDSGSLAEACIASSGLPGVFPPVRRGSQILVDGGIVDNVPGVRMKRRGADLVVAVNLTQECAVDLARSNLESSWLGGLVARVPGVRRWLENPAIHTILARSLDILMYANVRNTSWAFDVEIRPSLVEFTTLGLEGWRTMIDRGRVAAEAAVPEIRRRLAELDR